jgi:polyhydroxyalkanoate synthesis regulator phasin|tara:strand:+ start:1098 stop:1346 length:249 start_codon:yes stop_codon:yes gene_type:complete
MTELETLLLRQLEQQQLDSERLVSDLSKQLQSLQKTLVEQQNNSEELRRALHQSDQRNAAAVDKLTKRFEALTEQLIALRMR